MFPRELKVWLGSSVENLRNQIFFFFKPLWRNSEGTSLGLFHSGFSTNSECLATCITRTRWGVLKVVLKPQERSACWTLIGEEWGFSHGLYRGPWLLRHFLCGYIWVTSEYPELPPLCLYGSQLLKNWPVWQSYVVYKAQYWDSLPCPPCSDASVIKLPSWFPCLYLYSGELGSQPRGKHFHFLNFFFLLSLSSPMTMLSFLEGFIPVLLNNAGS